MQKKILLIAVYFTITGVCVNAQNKKHVSPPPPPPAPPTEHLIAPPPPPPPLPPESTVPPIPPAPPEPPVPPLKEINEIISASPVIVNSNGYETSVQKIKEKSMIIIEKDNVVQRIKLSTWNAKRKYYEKKYGHLPQGANMKTVLV